MFDFKLSKDGVSVLERSFARPEVVIAALQLLSQGEVLTVSLSDLPKKD